MDKEALQKLIDEALTKREKYEEALREVEKYIGLQADELGMEDGEMIDLEAEELIRLVEKGE